MLRSTFFAFLIGWFVWFWIDKPPPAQLKLPPVSDSLVENFQTAFNLLKAGYLDVAFVYIWGAHYLILSLLGGALLVVVYGAVSGYLSRKRLRKHFLPTKPAPKPSSPPADD